MVQKLRVFSTVALSVAAFISLSGCSLLRAREADNYGFLPKAELVAEDRERAPFNGYWVFDANEYDQLKRRYKKVYVAPINTEFPEKVFQRARGADRAKRARIEETRELAQYFREKIRLVSEFDSNYYVKVVNEPGEDVLTVNLALVELVPTNPGLNLVGTVAGFFVPGGGLLKIAAEGSVAMEGFVAEHKIPEELYEQFKDREGQKYSAFTLKDYQRYAHIREIHQVEDSDLVSINPL